MIRVDTIQRPSAHVQLEREQEEDEEYVVRTSGQRRVCEPSKARQPTVLQPIVLPGGLYGLILILATSTASTMSMRYLQHRPAVVKCPFNRQLMPPESVKTTDLDRERSPCFCFNYRDLPIKQDYLRPRTSLSSICGVL